MPSLLFSARLSYFYGFIFVEPPCFGAFVSLTFALDLVGLACGVGSLGRLKPALMPSHERTLGRGAVAICETATRVNMSGAWLDAHRPVVGMWSNPRR